MSEQLSTSMEHYLKTIYQLSNDGEGARITDIANTLQVTKPSTCHAVDYLETKGFLLRDDYHKVLLTRKGKELARKILDNYEHSKKLLLNIGLDERTASIQACALEHVMGK